MFGEISAVLNCRSSASVICKNYCTVAALSIEDYQGVTQQFPRLGEKMAHRVAVNNRDPLTHFFINKVSRVDYL